MSSDVLRARSALANLHNGRTPSPAEVDHARAKLCCAKIDAAIRRSVAASETVMNDAQVGHLVGLMLSVVGVHGDAATQLERLAREAVATEQGAA